MGISYRADNLCVHFVVSLVLHFVRRTKNEQKRIWILLVSAQWSKYFFFGVVTWLLQCKEDDGDSSWCGYKINQIQAVSTYTFYVYKCVNAHVDHTVIVVKTFLLSSHKKSSNRQQQPTEINAIWMLKPK